MGYKTHVMILIPSNGMIVADTVKSLTIMFGNACMKPFPGCSSVEEQKVSIMIAESSLLSANREKMVHKALRSDATHVLFLDSDMTFPMNTIHTLLKHDVDFVAANCTTRAEPILPVAHDLEGRRLPSKGKKGLEEVQHIGLAVALIKTSAIKKIKSPPLFLIDWIPELFSYCGEDVYFCQKLRQVGVPIMIDHDISREIGHVGKRVCKHSMIDYDAPEMDWLKDNGDL